jgi:hypothetical protein
VIPIAGDGSTHAFLEFFSDHRVEASPEMIELIEAIHIELWQAGQWRRDRQRRALNGARPGQGHPSAPSGCAPRPETVPLEAGIVK